MPWMERPRRRTRNPPRINLNKVYPAIRQGAVNDKNDVPVALRIKDY